METAMRLFGDATDHSEVPQTVMASTQSSNLNQLGPEAYTETRDVTTRGSHWMLWLCCW